MLSDIEIAQNAKMKKIGEIASSLGISEDYLEPYGHYKAKLSENLYSQTAFREDGKLILVTAINPTPAGEGKTTVSVGLAEAMGRIGKKLFSLFGNRLSDQYLVLKAELPEEDMLRSFLWRI